MGSPFEAELMGLKRGPADVEPIYRVTQIAVPRLCAACITRWSGTSCSRARRAQSSYSGAARSLPSGRVATLTDTSPHGVVTLLKAAWQANALHDLATNAVGRGFQKDNRLQALDILVSSRLPAAANWDGLSCNRGAANAPRAHPPRAGGRQRRRAPRATRRRCRIPA